MLQLPLTLFTLYTKAVLELWQTTITTARAGRVLTTPLSTAHQGMTPGWEYDTDQVYYIF